MVFPDRDQSTYLEPVVDYGATLNTWTHLAGVFDPNDVTYGPVLKLYTNGVLANIQAASVTEQYNSGLNVSIGPDPPATRAGTARLTKCASTRVRSATPRLPCWRRHP